MFTTVQTLGKTLTEKQLVALVRTTRKNWDSPDTDLRTKKAILYVSRIVGTKATKVANFMVATQWGVEKCADKYTDPELF
jgi:hypothetical protein